MGIAKRCRASGIISPLPTAGWRSAAEWAASEAEPFTLAGDGPGRPQGQHTATSPIAVPAQDGRVWYWTPGGLVTDDPRRAVGATLFTREGWDHWEAIA